MTITEALIQKESRDRYLTYALSVVSGRALPDVRDGLKPVQRRILYAMGEQLGLKPEHSHRKCAAVVGAVLASFHPHGDAACYEALVRMAQDFSLRYPLIEGQGNFGSLDGDSPAHYRYTEARLRPIAMDILGKIKEGTVSFRPNFDGTTQEPAVLPSRVPNLLMNGATGIAVGMATSIPPHNLNDLVKALLELSSNPEIAEARLATIVKAPDFPTGCSILNTSKELAEIYQTGRGSVKMRADWTTEEGNRGKNYIVITSIPYAVNKSQVVEKIADLIIQKKLPQLSDVRDESTDDVRVVLELASGADAEAAIAYLYRHTNLESNFSVSLTALVPGPNESLRPEVLSLKQLLQHFLDFREEVVRKELLFERERLLERLHILEGFIKIYDALDEALKIVRKSEGRSDAAGKLKVRFKLSDLQAFAIVDMRIYQLSKTNIEDIKAEHRDKTRRVKEIDGILKNRAKILSIIQNDLNLIAEKFGDKRKSKLIKGSTSELEYKEENYLLREDVYAIITRDGWLKRIRQANDLNTTRIREGDSIREAHALSTLDSVLFLTSHGFLYALKTSEFPASSGYGDPVQKFLRFKDGESIVATLPISSESIEQPLEVILLSEKGLGFRAKLEGLDQLKRAGRKIMKLKKGDRLVSACQIAGKTLFMFSRAGSGLAISLEEVPSREGASVGVALMGVRSDDLIVSAITGSKADNFVIELSEGKDRKVLAKDIVQGHRALKGNKVVSRAEIKCVRKQ